MSELRMKKIDGLTQPSIALEDLDPKHWNCPVYPINEKWTEEIHPLIETDRKFARLVKEALASFLRVDYGKDCKLPENWDLWDGRPPWGFSKINYYDEVINPRIGAFIHSNDPEAVELKAIIESRGYDHESVDDIYRMLAWRFEPEVDSAEYFRVVSACHWVSEYLAYAVKKLRPNHDIRVVEGIYHSCVLDRDAYDGEGEVFDLLIFDQHPLFYAMNEEDENHHADVKAGLK